MVSFAERVRRRAVHHLSPSADQRADDAQLFVVGGASLLSALEAREHFAVRAQDAVLLATQRALTSGLVDEEEWRAVHPFQANVRGRGLGRLRAWREFTRSIDGVLGRRPRFRRAFLADCGEPMQYIAAAAGAEDVVILDDGLATIVAASQRRKAPPPAPRALARRVLKSALAGRRIRELDRVTFFSAYDIEGGPDDTVVRHDYPRLRRAFEGRDVSGETWFVGQPFVENGSLTERDFHAIVGRACAQLGGEVRYVAHPNERDERLTRMAADTGVPWRRFAQPLEIVIAAGTSRPCGIAGFSSSVLANAAVVFPTVAVTAFEIPERLFQKPADGSRMVMDYLRRTRVDVRPLAETPS